MSFSDFRIPYQVDDYYSKKIAYFSMEFAVHQPLKIYSGGLGYLAGSHLRSAYELRQNMVGIGILWKYGYYDQSRNQDHTLHVSWMEKNYSFLEDTGIKFQITVHEHPVWVKVYYLNPETFHTAPLFLLSTDLPENDFVSQTISHRLYDANVATKVAQFILLGVGGGKAADQIVNFVDVLDATFQIGKARILLQIVALHRTQQRLPMRLADADDRDIAVIARVDVVRRFSQPSMAVASARRHAAAGAEIQAEVRTERSVNRFLHRHFHQPADARFFALVERRHDGAIQMHAAKKIA